MGNDLFSACVFCAGLLFGTNLPPPSGLHVEAGFSYATAARRYEIPDGRNDESDVTPKFVFVGFGGARPAADGSGAGTPAAEWKVRVALGPSHDEQEQTPFALTNTNATGTGRFENYAIVLRHPFSARDSLETAASRRYQSSTDRVDIGQERYVLSETPGSVGGRREVALIATGSEVAPAVEAQAALAGRGVPSRVVSMPCPDLFLKQPEEYRMEVLPRDVRRVVIEAARPFGWERVAGCEALLIGIDRFGASAPYKALVEKFGLTGPQIADRVLRWIGAS